MMFCLSGCTSNAVITNYVDEATGASVAKIGGVLEFFRDASHSGAYARDLLSVAPVRINRAGDHQFYLWVARWSSVTERTDAGPDELSTLFFLIDGEPIELSRQTLVARSIGLGSAVYEPPTSSASIVYYSLTAGQLAAIARGKSIRVALAGGGRTFGLWRRDDALLALIRDFSGL